MLSLVYYSNVLFSHEESTTPLTEESTTPLKESNSLKKGVTPRYVSNYESNYVYESNVVVCTRTNLHRENVRYVPMFDVISQAGDRCDPRNYRPITLLNTDYKILFTTRRAPPSSKSEI